MIPTYDNSNRFNFLKLYGESDNGERVCIILRLMNLGWTPKQPKSRFLFKLSDDSLEIPLTFGKIKHVIFQLRGNILESRLFSVFNVIMSSVIF